MSFELSVSEAKRLGFALQAHAITMSGDIARPVWASILVEPCDAGFTITSTDSYMCFHTEHFVGDTGNGSHFAEAFRLAPNPNRTKPANVVRELGKALATCGLPVRLTVDDGVGKDNGDRLHFLEAGAVRDYPEQGITVALPVDVAPAKDFPNYWPLFRSVHKAPVPDPDTGKVPELNRGLVLGARLVMVLAKVQALAVKAAKTGNAGEALLVMEPNGTGLGPVPFFFTVDSSEQGRERWNGIVMPVKYDFASDREFLIPAVCRD